jgi:hypothetical protein
MKTTRALGTLCNAVSLLAASIMLIWVSVVGAVPELGGSGNVYDLGSDTFVLEATFVGRPGVRYAASRTPTGTVNVDDRDPFLFGPFVGCFLGERDRGRVVSSGDSCELALRFENTTDRDIADVEIGLSHSGLDGGPVATWTSGRFFGRVAAGDSTVVDLTLRFDEPVGLSANQFTAVGIYADNGEPFTETVEFTYEVSSAPPTVPQSVTRSQHGSSFLVSWMSPLSDGGSPVTGYLTRIRIEHPDWAAEISDTSRWLYDQIACVAPATQTTCEVPNEVLESLPPGSGYRFAVTALTELVPDGGFAFYTEPFDVPEPDRAATGFADATSLEELVAASDVVPDLDAPILRLYVAYFNRDPDLGGAKYWLGVRRQGFSLDEIAGFMSNSLEFRSTYEGMSDRTYVEVIYRNVLGRPHDRAGSEYWLALLEEGTLSRSGVVRWITSGDEFISHHRFIPTVR